MKIGKIVKVFSRFGRSVNLERDFYNHVPIEGYVLTSTASSALGRIVESIKDKTVARAWTLTGPYGSGKSIFALFAAKVFYFGTSIESDQAKIIVRENDPELWSKLVGGEGPLPEQIRLFPILISGARENLGTAILRGIASALRNDETNRFKNLINNLDLLEANSQVSGAEIIALLREISRILSRRKQKVGILLVIDELGKLLEFVALRPSESDVFLLQELAEATRHDEFPFFLMTILHQAFERYAEKLGRREREEWMKVQGRFEDLPFQEPNEQILYVLQNAFEKNAENEFLDSFNRYSKSLAEKAFDIGLCGNFNKIEAIRLLGNCVPLHPVVSLSIGSIFRRFGQNERSLFAFLTSNETFGLLAFLETTEWHEENRESLRLDRVYDYLVSAMGSALFAGAESRKWAEIESALNRSSEISELEIRLLKTVGILRLIGESGKLKSSREVLRFALQNDNISEHDVDLSLAKLQSLSIITERKFNETFAIWEGSDVNLDERLKEAERNVDPTVSLAQSLQKYFQPSPLIAKRHSDETGTLRLFEIAYADQSDVRKICNLGFSLADGRIIYALTNNQEEFNDLTSNIGEGVLGASAQTIIAIPTNLSNLREAMFMTACWFWVKQNTPELENDRAARTELEGRLFHAQQSVLKWLNDLQTNTSNSTCVWYWNGGQILMPSPRSLQNLLSEVCDRVFVHAPILRNELINRRTLSSAAAAARRSLCDLMIKSPTLPHLGIEGFPPQLSIYFSVLEQTTIHRYENGVLGFFPPNKNADPGIIAVWERIVRFLEETEGKRKTVAEIFQILQMPPYGLKSGVLPLLLVCALLHFDSEVALYERDNFVAKLTIPIVERLCKTPDIFAIQYCRIDDLRSQVIEKLAATLLPVEISKQKERLDVLTLVRPLAIFSNSLNDFTRQTSRVSADAQRVRQAILSAREPDVLLFNLLPKALNCSPFTESKGHTIEDVSDFCQKLRSSLSELKRAYENLLDEIEKMLISGFSLTKSGEDIRLELVKRVRLIADYAVSTKLKSFVLRITDESLDFRSWLESIGSLIVGKPLANWYDRDVAHFEINLAEIVRSFTSLESLAFEIRSKSSNFSVENTDFLRLSITRLGEMEHERVVSINDDEMELLRLVENSMELEFEKAGLNGNMELRLTILANLSWKLLQKTNLP